jgi:hypothetical protein
MIKSRRKKWTGHVGCMRGRVDSEHLGVDGRISKWVLGKYSWRVCTGFFWLKIGILAGSCEDGNEASVSIKG